MFMPYNKDIKYIKGVGEKTAGLFNKLGVFNVGSLFSFYPKNYKDFSNITKISDTLINETYCIKAKISSNIETKKTKNITLFNFTIYDKTGALNVTLFNTKFLAASLKKDQEYLFYGKIEGGFNGGFNKLNSPEILPLENAKILPVYPLTKGLSNKVVQKVVKNALFLLDDDDYLPDYIKQKYKLISYKEAIINIHFPKNADFLKQSRRRLIFDELFLLKLGQNLIKNRFKISSSRQIEKSYFEEYKKLLPFNLTASQEKAIKECLLDMHNKKAMNRLLQGDVGSGKTAVAAALIYSAFKNGEKSVFMAPTSILATQHYNNLKALLPNLKIGLLIGSVTKAKKDKIKQDYKQNKLDLLIGTHALIVNGDFLNGTCLCITDEQHRFGVAQRAVLSQNSGSANCLYMSATPIPRTLSMAIYGELDISVLTELPRGRKPIDSFFVNESYRQRVYNFIKKELDNNKQAYIVCPLVDDNETDLIPVKEYYNQLITHEFKNYPIGLLHGKMKPKEKEQVMQDFLNKKFLLLLCTTIVEVGIDVKNVTVMLVNNAERFGLSTLHQLRGRIGRNSEKSTFIMISDKDSKRLEIIAKEQSGFKIAEEDLALRGPGSFLGERQHGLPELKLANLLLDGTVLEVATKEAETLINNNNSFKEYPLLLEKIKALFTDLDINI